MTEAPTHASITLTGRTVIFGSAQCLSSLPSKQLILPSQTFAIKMTKKIN